MKHPQLESDEHLILALQDHWITMAVPVFLWLVGMGVSVLFVLASFHLDGLGTLASGGLYLAAVAIALLSTHWFFIYALEHEVSAWIVTNKRLISFGFLPYVKHDVNFIVISELHKITKIKHGLLQNLLNYGDIDINLAASPETVRLKYVPKPARLCNILERLQKEPLEAPGLKRLLESFKD